MPQDRPKCRNYSECIDREMNNDRVMGKKIRNEMEPEECGACCDYIPEKKKIDPKSLTKDKSPIELITTFLEQERNYADKCSDNKNKTKSERIYLEKRVSQFNSVISILNESRTKEGLNRIKEAIEKEQKRLNSL